MHWMERSPQLHVRLAGLMYLAIIVLGLFGEAYVRGTLVVSGDAAATARAIAGHESLWRSGIAGDLLMHVFDVPVMIVLYLLLRPVSHSLALLMTAFNVLQTAVLIANKMTLVVPLLVYKSAPLAAVLSPAQVDALAYTFISAHGYGFGLGLVFFGIACVIRGYLVVKSGFLPAFLGWLLAIAGFCYLINTFALLLAPGLASALFPAILLPAFVGELLFASWLAFKGIDVDRYAERLRVSR